MEQAFFRMSLILGPLAVAGLLLMLPYVGLLQIRGGRLPLWPLWVFMAPLILFITVAAALIIAMLLMISWMAVGL